MCDWATAGDFELAKNGVKVLFHRRQTQPGVIGDLLVARPIADKLHDFVFASRQFDKCGKSEIRWRQTPAECQAKIFTLDQKMRPRYARRAQFSAGWLLADGAIADDALVLFLSESATWNAAIFV